MKELRNGWPSIVPRTFTRPFVPKNEAESGITTYVQPPLAGDFCSFALNFLSIVPAGLPLVISLSPRNLSPEIAEQSNTVALNLAIGLEGHEGHPQGRSPHRLRDFVAAPTQLGSAAATEHGHCPLIPSAPRSQPCGDCPPAGGRRRCSGISAEGYWRYFNRSVISALLIPARATTVIP